ncbi:unnamed protein product [Ostreobium quekettii]|uniref:Uncharacterized protein n=1 Tax=Ostreobium quekettii TaxID=121088 RepID=A0A8S1IX52_9CHLO|nr:unnamed protein product [Ostreobium quekettii]|eukprot:evm.model.scf_272.2 EVM.evm.TU.scf_272.2   scf_272:17875-18192(+)
MGHFSNTKSISIVVDVVGLIKNGAIVQSRILSGHRQLCNAVEAMNDWVGTGTWLQIPGAVKTVRLCGGKYAQVPEGIIDAELWVLFVACAKSKSFVSHRAQWARA